MRTLKEIKLDLQSYKALTKRQQGVTMYAEKYVQDVEALTVMLDAKSDPKNLTDTVELKKRSQKTKPKS